MTEQTNKRTVANTRVRLPNGKIYSAEIRELAETGYRHASVKVTLDKARVRVSGRVSTRHGFANDRILPFEVNLNGSNAYAALTSTGEDVYVTTV